MDDVRVQWVGEQLLSALGHKDPAPFEELLNHGDGEGAEKLLHFFNVGASTEESKPAALFFQQEMRLEEIDVKIGARRVL